MRKTEPEHVLLIDSPVGRITLCSRSGALTHLLFGECFPQYQPDSVLYEAAHQLEEYFSGQRREFCLPLNPAGTPFQLEVWRALTAIPYGCTACYSDIARAIGRPQSCRAVGQANHVNPISIIIPCHRVVGKNGALTGYGGGLSVKNYLLSLENRISAE